MIEPWLLVPSLCTSPQVPAACEETPAAGKEAQENHNLCNLFCGKPYFQKTHPSNNEKAV